jgi:glycosyltransferase involved in cell wall biosynthesis
MPDKSMSKDIKALTIDHNLFGLSAGGTEAYAAQIFKLFDGRLRLYLNPSKNVKTIDLKAYLSRYYGIKLQGDILPGRFFRRGLYINGTVNCSIPPHRYGIHIVHFPEKITIRPRLNLYKLLLSAARKIFYPKSYLFYLCNSEFTASVFKQYWRKTPENRVKVLYPPVQMYHPYRENSKRKRQIVLCSRISDDKKIEILIQTFTKYFYPSDLRLVVAGSVNDKKQEKYFNHLKSISNENILFFVNKERGEIESLFNESLIFWHSKGFEEADPYRFEHFGITTVEAMSAGLIPVVINKGGQREIVDHGVNGYRWDTLDELVFYTRKILSMPLIDGGEGQLSLAKNATQKAEKYSVENFNKEFLKLLDDSNIRIRE